MGPNDVFLPCPGSVCAITDYEHLRHRGLQALREDGGGLCTYRLQDKCTVYGPMFQVEVTASQAFDLTAKPTCRAGVQIAHASLFEASFP